MAESAVNTQGKSYKRQFVFFLHVFRANANKIFGSFSHFESTVLSGILLIVTSSCCVRDLSPRCLWWFHFLWAQFSHL